MKAFLNAEDVAKLKTDPRFANVEVGNVIEDVGCFGAEMTRLMNQIRMLSTPARK